MGFFDILSAFVPLLIVVALLYGVLVLVRKYGYNLKGKESAAVDIKVVSSKMIMPKKYVSVIKVEGKLLVLGVSEHSINLLKELDADEDDYSREDNQVANYRNTEPVQGQSFLDIMKKNFGLK